MDVIIETLVESDPIAPKGTPTEIRIDNTTDAEGIESTVTLTNNNAFDPTSLDLNTFLTAQKQNHIDNLPSIIDKNLQLATPL